VLGTPQVLHCHHVRSDFLQSFSMVEELDKENAVNSFCADCWGCFTPLLLCLCPVPSDFNFMDSYRRTFVT
jgi:hypothetical protein